MNYIFDKLKDFLTTNFINFNSNIINFIVNINNTNSNYYSIKYKEIPKDKQKEIIYLLDKYIKYGIDDIKSFYYLFRTLLYIFIYNTLIYQLYDYIPLYTSLLFILHSFISGTITTGLWVIGHECGHKSFSNYKIINNSIGFILHSLLLVPYFSWAYSHSIHHKFVNHILKDTVHNPRIFNKDHTDYKNLIKNNTFIVNIKKSLETIFFGWYYYLLFYTTGAKVQYDQKTPIDNKLNKSHFTSKSQVMPKTSLIGYSTIGNILAVLFILNYYNFNIINLTFWYIGPLIFVNMWLVLITFLQHTHVNVPKFNDNSNFIETSFATIDRRPHYIIDHLHLNISSSHVIHHLNSKIPHYYAKEATIELENKFSEYYLVDKNLFILSLYNSIYDYNFVYKYNDKLYYYLNFQDYDKQNININSINTLFNNINNINNINYSNIIPEHMMNIDSKNDILQFNNFNSIDELNKMMSTINPKQMEEMNKMMSTINPKQMEEMNKMMSTINPKQMEEMNKMMSTINPKQMEEMNKMMSAINPKQMEEMNKMMSAINPKKMEEMNQMMSAINPKQMEEMNQMMSAINPKQMEEINQMMFNLYKK
jgi:fatty acid desaturase